MTRRFILWITVCLMIGGSIAHADLRETGNNLGYFAKPRYIGSIYCYACHADISRKFAETKMGRVFQLKPESDIEKLGCEGCHGPGSNHAIVGGGLGVGGLIEFRQDRGQSVETANRACLNCHDEAFWHRATENSQRLACYDCHLVMTRLSRTGQLTPPHVAPWNNWRSWGGAIIAGALAGLLSGTVYRRRWFDSRC